MEPRQLRLPGFTRLWAPPRDGRGTARRRASGGGGGVQVSNPLRQTFGLPPPRERGGSKILRFRAFQRQPLRPVGQRIFVAVGAIEQQYALVATDEATFQ